MKRDIILLLCLIQKWKRSSNMNIDDRKEVSLSSLFSHWSLDQWCSHHNCSLRALVFEALATYTTIFYCLLSYCNFPFLTLSPRSQYLTIKYHASFEQVALKILSKLPASTLWCIKNGFAIFLLCIFMNSSLN